MPPALRSGSAIIGNLMDNGKPLDKPIHFASPRSYEGKVERTSKGRKFAPKRYTMDEEIVTYTDGGERRVRNPTVRPKMVLFQGRYYPVSKSIAGA